MLFSLFPYDFPLLWTSTPPPDPFTPLETHYLILADAPPLIQRILHIVVGIGYFGFFLKLWRATESNMLFDGASLVLYVIATVIYITNIVKGLNIVKAGTYENVDILADQQKNPHGVPVVRLEGVLNREDSLKVLSASHTILALVLMGVLVFQAGQWYADRKEGHLVANTEENDSPQRLTRGKKRQ